MESVYHTRVSHAVNLLAVGAFLMNPVQFYVGIDISNHDFTVSVLTEPQAPVHTLPQVPNTYAGFEKLEAWLISHKVHPTNSVLCMETTGVYGEALAYFLTAKGYRVAAEPPLKVKRAFPHKGHKNDTVDSVNIAEYAYRFADELRTWRPKPALVEQIRILLTTREQLVQQKTALTNALKALQKKVVQTPLANQIYQENIQRLHHQIKQIEKELNRLIDKHPDFRKIVTLLISIPGVGMLLAANFLVATNGFENDIAFHYRKAAAYIGICPYEYTSGSSVYRRPRIPKYGPSKLRKLLHLAARSVVTHNANFAAYYQQKLAQGKTPKLVLNNVSNKLLKIMCAIIRTRKNFVDNYVSIYPHLAQINP